MRTWFPLSMVSLALAGATVGPASAQGVPTFDLRLFAERQAILEQTDRDLALQQDRLTHEEELAEIERQQLASLEGLMDAAFEVAEIWAKSEPQAMAAAKKLYYAVSEEPPAEAFDRGREVNREMRSFRK